MYNRLASDVVPRLSESICQSLCAQELLKYVSIPELKFLTDEERLFLLQHDPIYPSGQLVRFILYYLDTREKSRREDDFRKFVACVIRASEHRGHKELTKFFRAKIGDEEWLLIRDIESKSRTPLPSPYQTPQNSPYQTPQNSPIPACHVISPEKPLTLNTLEGRLVEDAVLDIDRQLWLSFSKGDYSNLKCVIEKMHEEHGKFDKDCEVVAMWFESLFLMHSSKKYDDALEKLDGAQELAGDTVNENILVGRILQRKAQVYLMKGKKLVGAEHFKMAKERLQSVGRGYDKTNMFCREAKMLSATEPHRRDDIEKVYQAALDTLEKDDPYFLASYPSVTLSKAAFHLHLAFGSKPTSEDRLPMVSSDDVLKAKETLSSFSVEEHILLDMRKLEFDVIQAELCRVEGRMEEARRRFTQLKCTVETNGVGNIAAIVEHRLAECYKEEMVRDAVPNCLLSNTTPQSSQAAVQLHPQDGLTLEATPQQCECSGREAPTMELRVAVTDPPTATNL